MYVHNICIYNIIYMYNIYMVVYPSECHIFNLFRSFFLCYPGEALEGPISTGVCKTSTMLTQITTYKYEKLLCIYICMYMYVYVCICMYTYI